MAPGSMQPRWVKVDKHNVMEPWACCDVAGSGSEGMHYPMKLLPRVQQQENRKNRVSVVGGQSGDREDEDPSLSIWPPLESA